MEWITANWVSVVGIITGIVTVASVVAKLTPTKTDDKLVGYALKFIDFLAINNKPTEIKKTKSGEQV